MPAREYALTRPGITVPPFASMIRAPVGTFTLAPTSRILPLRITITPIGMTLPSIVMIRALVIAVGRPCAEMALVPRTRNIALTTAAT